MTLIWKRRGFLAFLFCYGGLLGASVLVDLIAGTGSYALASNLWGGLGLITGGLLTVLVGTRLNRRSTEGPEGHSPAVPLPYSEMHTFFWAPMEYWGGLSILAGVAAVIVHLA